MKGIFSLVGILVLVAIAIWWFGNNYNSAENSNNQMSEVNIPDNMVDLINDPIEAAKDTKDIIEGNNGSRVDLSNQGLTVVPESVFKQTSTVTLDLSNNNLSGSLQGEIRFLNKLTMLDLSNNDFTGIPAEVGQLKELQELDLSNNKLTGLPQEIGNLQSLKVLNLSGNAYSETDLALIKAKLPANVTIITK